MGQGTVQITLQPCRKSLLRIDIVHNECHEVGPRRSFFIESNDDGTFGFEDAMKEYKQIICSHRPMPKICSVCKGPLVRKNENYVWDYGHLVLTIPMRCRYCKACNVLVENLDDVDDAGMVYLNDFDREDKYSLAGAGSAIWMIEQAIECAMKRNDRGQLVYLHGAKRLLTATLSCLEPLLDARETVRKTAGVDSPCEKTPGTLWSAETDEQIRERERARQAKKKKTQPRRS